MENKMTMAEAVFAELGWFSAQPISVAEEWAGKLGREAYKLKAANEENVACFEASKALAAATHAWRVCRLSFRKGWKDQKKEIERKSVDLPRYLRGFSKLPDDAFVLLAQRGCK